MKLRKSKSYSFTVLKEGKSGPYAVSWDLDVMVESRSGRLDPSSGEIISVKELDESVAEASEKFDGKLLSDVRGWGAIPQTLEMLIIRVWEWIEDALPHYARLAKLRLYEGKGYFVEYDGRSPFEKRKRSK